jgi:cytochrome oxidase Cu insertion factor (SCO1/SenC/PrrC family)
MKQRITAFGLLLLLAAASFGQAKPAPQQAGPPPLKLKVGDTVPDFTLRYVDGDKLKDISLHDYAGKKNVLLAFFIFAFTGG